MLKVVESDPGTQWNSRSAPDAMEHFSKGVQPTDEENVHFWWGKQPDQTKHNLRRPLKDLNGAEQTETQAIEQVVSYIP